MPLATVKNALIASAAVKALIGDRVSPLEAAMGTAFPRVVLTVPTVNPYAHLQGSANLDECTVRVSAWAFTYAAALEIADACRAALDAAGHICIGRLTDDFGPEKDPGAYRVGYDFRVWI